MFINLVLVSICYLYRYSTEQLTSCHESWGWLPLLVLVIWYVIFNPWQPLHKTCHLTSNFGLILPSIMFSFITPAISKKRSKFVMKISITYLDQGICHFCPIPSGRMNGWTCFYTAFNPLQITSNNCHPTFNFSSTRISIMPHQNTFHIS